MQGEIHWEVYLLELQAAWQEELQTWDHQRAEVHSEVYQMQEHQDYNLALG